MGIQNAALYLYDKPIYKEEGPMQYPDTICLKSVIKSGTVFMIPEAKQERPLAEIFTQREIRIYNRKFTTFPIFYERYYYGYFLCELNEDIFNKGEIITSVLGAEFGMLNSRLQI